MIYLIYSESIKLLNDNVKKIVGGKGIIDQIDYSISNIDEVVEEAATFSLFEETKFLVVKNCNNLFIKPTKNEEELLLKYLNAPNNLTTLFFLVTEEPKKDNDTFKIIKNTYKYIALKKMTIRDIYTKVEDYFKMCNLKISKDSIYYIVNNSLNNYDLAMNEAEKVSIYYDAIGSNQVKYDDLIYIVFPNMDSNIFHFTNEVISKNLNESLKKLQELKVHKVDLAVLLSALSREFRTLYNVKILTNDNILSTEIMKLLNLKDWQLKKFQDLMYSYNQNELRDILLKIALLDYKYKSGETRGYIGLELLLIEL